MTMTRAFKELMVDAVVDAAVFIGFLGWLAILVTV
jgi:hypothetical protein